jgi:cation:H+ antiporter
MLTIILFIIGFVFLVKGADFLVEGASSIARHFQVSDLVIGLTVVSFGTSTPELFVNIIASVEESAEIAVGNVLGSNIANIFLILGISAILLPLNVSRGTVWKEIPLSLLAAVLLGIMVNDKLIDNAEFSQLTRIDGMVFIAFFIVFMYYSFSIAKKIEGLNAHVPASQYTLFKSIGMILLGLIGLTLGGKWIVEGAIVIAKAIGMSKSFIGLSIVAIGTSLPELATSAVAACKKNAEIAVGNVVGSNIFNIFFVLGVSSIIKPIPFQPQNNFDIGMVIFSSILLFACMFKGKKQIIERWKGILFVGLYLLYLAILICIG